jgi:hypothetical protein
MDNVTHATASAGVLQYFISAPNINPYLQTVFLLVSIVWVGTQIFHKWFKKDPK